MTTGPRIYNLFPLLAGAIEGKGRHWHSHLPRIAAMRFDWVFLNPFHEPGFSGSLYAVKDPYRLHPLLRGRSKKSDDRLLGDFFRAAGEHRLKVMMDLVINHTARDAKLQDDHPDWYERDEEGELVSPGAIDPADARNQTVWGDLARLDYETPEIREALIAYWSDYLRHYIQLGVKGFRCDAAYQLPPGVWSELIAAGRTEDPDLVFVAETLGAALDQVEGLARAGFDFFYNSAKWWDFQAPWLLEQYEQFRHVAPSIAFPESHDTERLAAELGVEDPDRLEAYYRQRYLFSAVFSSGVMMPMGYEYGFSRRTHVVDTRPEDWEEPKFDLRPFIAEVNGLKLECPSLGIEGSQRRLICEDPSIVPLLRSCDQCGSEGGTLALINLSPERNAILDPAPLLSQVEQNFDLYVDISPGAGALTDPLDSPIELVPLELRVWCASHASAKDHLAELKGARLPASLIQAVVGASTEDPFGVRGLHPEGPEGSWIIRTFQSGADRVELIEGATGDLLAELERQHRAGLFAGRVDGFPKAFPYRLRVTRGDRVEQLEDPYRFPPVLGELDLHLLAEGKHLRSFEKLGAHPMTLDGVAGVAFALWAPSAQRVAVVGDFNDWDGRMHPMRLRHECGVWELFIPAVPQGSRYKYEIKGANGELLPLKTDPFAFWCEQPPKNAARVWKFDGFEWTDQDWLTRREEAGARDAPVSIYEVHLGSWRRVSEEGNRYLTYRELADELVPYVTSMGFSHIELMPISEYPFDGSWGYQPVGLYAPTSRFGTPTDFKHFVNACHEAGIGVILDWVPGHFPTDAHGLGFFDGTHLYEHADPRQGFHQDWNTLIYNYNRNEVRNYLLGNALFWIEEYHLDGLRVDAVASMLYLDYSRKEGEWIPNKYGGRENLDAIELLQQVNTEVYGTHPGVATIAEESTSWPGVSRPVYLGGLGFGYKWNMGWMHDTLDYMGHEPIHRRYHHDRLTFGLVYAFGENYVLPLSHDEVVHGKGSLIARMPGDAWQKFANLRAYLGFMWTHPGKKLLFMGSEFAQGKEWNHDKGLDWEQLEIPWHAGVQRLVRDLNRLYWSLPALHEKDCESDGFEWIEASDTDQSVFAFLRKGKEESAPVVVACNLTPVPRHDYRIGVPERGFYAERLNSDSTEYEGSGTGNGRGLASEATYSQARPHSILATLPPLATLVFALERDETEVPEAFEH
jgi:1,4-alpha-glucan branching enzyme